MNETVSVCIPVYNGGPYLRECLDSVLAQTYRPLEITVVDDCSTDDSVSIIEAYRLDHPEIRYFRNATNLGLVGNWNRCVELVTHDWIKFVFQDDVIAPTCIERLMQYADRPPALIACRRDFFFEEGVAPAMRKLYLHNQRRIDGFFAGTDHATAQECQRVAIERFGSNMFGEPTAVLLHRSFFERFGKFHDGMINSCDLEFWVRVSIHTGAYYVPDSLATFRVHDSATSAVNRRNHEFRKDFLDNLLLIQEFATKKVYEPLRQHGAKRALPVDLVACFRTLTHHAYAKADWVRRDRQSPNDRPMRELVAFYREFPRLRVGRFAHAFWRIKTRIATTRARRANLRAISE